MPRVEPPDVSCLSPPIALERGNVRYAHGAIASDRAAPIESLSDDPGVDDSTGSGCGCGSTASGTNGVN
jgi:hypothetical protein